MNDVAINYKAVLFYGLIIGAIIIAIIYFLPLNPNPIHNAVTSAGTWINANVINKVGSSSIGSTIKQNGPMILGVGAAVVPLAYTTIRSYLDKAALKKQLEAAQELAIEKEKLTAQTIASTKSLGTDRIASLEKELADLKSDSPLTEAQRLVTQKNATISSLENQMKGIQSLHNSFIDQFHKAANGAVIKDPLTGESIKVLKEVIVQVR